MCVQPDCTYIIYMLFRASIELQELQLYLLTCFPRKISSLHERKGGGKGGRGVDKAKVNFASSATEHVQAHDSEEQLNLD